MLLTKQHTFGKLDVTVYDFEEVDDELPMHTHDEGTAHVSIVARGRLLAFGPGYETELKPGQMVDWLPGVWHGFRALESGARLINIRK